jgi:hypothetical protein
MGKLKLELNNTQNLRDLLQSAYNLADEQIIQAQNEINKMANATQLKDESIEGKAKYGKIINDYLGIKDKAISKKLDIAKIMSDVLHYNGNVQQALDEGANIKNMDFNFDDIKKMVDESYSDKEKTKTIQLDKK